MTNKEKYKGLINIIEGGGIAINKKTGLPCACADINCKNCLWRYENCIALEKEWLKQEYVPNDDDNPVIAIDKHIIADSITHYGADMQTTVCAEECGELVQAICKMKRGKPSRDNLIEEMADVLICIEILKQIYAISDSEIANWIKCKQAREVGRMKEGE